jgi:hypothetical protein
MCTCLRSFPTSSRLGREGLVKASTLAEPTLSGQISQRCPKTTREVRDVLTFFFLLFSDLTYDIWHLTSDIWHLTNDRWQRTNDQGPMTCSDSQFYSLVVSDHFFDQSAVRSQNHQSNTWWIWLSRKWYNLYMSYREYSLDIVELKVVQPLYVE